MRKLKVKALAEYLPDTIDIDVTNLDLGQSIKVGSLKLENMELLDNKSNIIVTVSMTRAARSASSSATANEDTSSDTAS